MRQPSSPRRNQMQTHNQAAHTTSSPPSVALSQPSFYPIPIPSPLCSAIHLSACRCLITISLLGWPQLIAILFIIFHLSQLLPEPGLTGLHSNDSFTSFTSFTSRLTACISLLLVSFQVSCLSNPLVDHLLTSSSLTFPACTTFVAFSVSSSLPLCSLYAYSPSSWIRPPLVSRRPRTRRQSLPLTDRQSPRSTPLNPPKTRRSIARSMLLPPPNAR